MGSRFQEQTSDKVSSARILEVRKELEFNVKLFL